MRRKLEIRPTLSSTTSKPQNEIHKSWTVKSKSQLWEGDREVHCDEPEKSRCNNGCFQDSSNGDTGTSISQEFLFEGKAFLRMTSTCTAGYVHKWTYIHTRACTVSWSTRGARLCWSAPQKVIVMTDPLNLYTRNPEDKSPSFFPLLETFLCANLTTSGGTETPIPLTLLSSCSLQ